MHTLKPLKQRWTPARYAARMEKRARRAAGARPDTRNTIHIPKGERHLPMGEGSEIGLMAALASLLGTPRRRRSAHA